MLKILRFWTMAVRPRQLRRKARPSGASGTLGPWLTFAGVIVTATVALIVTLINRADPSPAKTTAVAAPTLPKMTPSETATLDTAPGGIAITSWTQSPMPPPPGEHFEFDGTLTDPPDTFPFLKVFIVADSSASAAPNAEAPYTSSPWLISPPADLQTDGAWRVRWDLAKPPESAHFTAVLVLSAASAGIETGVPDYWELLNELQAEGFPAERIIATAPAPPTATVSTKAQS